MQAWLDGLIYRLFGAPGLELFSREPLLFAAVALVLLGLAVAAAVVLARRGLGAVRAAVYRAPRDARLLLSADGRRGLRAARGIRAGSRRLRRTVRHSVPDRSERRELQRMLERFTRHELEWALDRLRVLVVLRAGREPQRLEAALHRDTTRWAEAGSPEREALQERVASTRYRLAHLQRVEGERAALLAGLEDAALAMSGLEDELTALPLAREQSLPRFRRQVDAATDQLRFLREAHQTLG